MEKSYKEYKAPALSRGLQVLQYLAGCEEPKTMVQLVNELSLSFNQLYRIIYCLQEEGFLRQDIKKRYHLTDKIQFQNAHDHIQRFAQSPICRQLLHDFTWHTNQPCHIASLKNDEFIVIAHAAPEFSPGIGARDGASLNVTKSSSALLYLALASSPNVLQLMRNHLLPLEQRADLLSQLLNIKKQGYCAVKHDRIIGLTSVSYPIFDQDTYAEAVITCPYFDHVHGDYEEVKNKLQLLSISLTDSYSNSY
ncbi:IclR family transcriptional regulator [Yersinia kristensenii]|uniref:IclR family transcriptional regulator n=1 Tax=Yersinia kristensenii TaxID=28152 RepID=UPI0011A2A20C|nr:helix-turn-helix domain-containing protein [Yersinia kristensenii]